MSLIRRAIGVLSAAAMVALAAGIPANAEPVEADVFDALGTVPTADLCGPAEPGYAQCLSVVRTDLVGATTLDATPGGYGPADIQDAYDLPSDSAGDGMTVAIVDAFDNPSVEADLGVYRAQYGLSECTTDNGCFRKVDQRGGTDFPRFDPGWAGEIALDVDMVSAACPNCDILLVEADTPTFDDLGTAVNTAVELGADFVSNSYGTRGGEFPDQTQYDHYYDHPGVGITVSSGDDGYITSWPATSPDVTAVGGTSLLRSDEERGWSERAWAGAGSGCSAIEPKPEFQTDPDCAGRMMADVAAVADPATGVAVYNSNENGQVPPGWAVFGGTSASAPIIASVYALAGAPATGEYPNTYPYATPAGLYDVAGGANGTCDVAYFCQAVPGYDGPTGLGTPHGVTAFEAPGDRGVVTGTVTDSDTGQPVEGATVTAGELSAHTDADGAYRIAAPVGTYDVSATAFGYQTVTRTGVEVGLDATVTVDLAMDPTATTTITGLVNDGAGHWWPLHAKITVDDVTVDPVWSDPFTGRYELRLPVGDTYTLRIDPDIPGYETVTEEVDLTESDDHHHHRGWWEHNPRPIWRNIQVPVDVAGCSAPGYSPHTGRGDTEGFDSGALPEGWTATDDNGSGTTWAFDDPTDRGNNTGGEGGFAVADSAGRMPETSLISPSIDMRRMFSPSVSFRTEYRAYPGASATVEYSVGGGDWTTVWTDSDEDLLGAELVAMLPDAAGESDVRVRFHFTAGLVFWWELDDVFLGDRTCVPRLGGLIAGTVSDKNTGDGVNDVTVTRTDRPSETATTAASADPEIGDGYYWMFTKFGLLPKITASERGYVDASKRTVVLPNWTVRTDFRLAAGHLVVGTDEVSGEQEMGSTTTHTVDLINDGTAPLDVDLGERDTGVREMLTRSGAALRRIPGDYSPEAMATTGTSATEDTGTESDSAAADPMWRPWNGIADYPVPIFDNAVVTAHDGTVYSFGGSSNNVTTTGASYAYDPEAGEWHRIADEPHPRQRANAAEYQGKIYLVSGNTLTGEGVPETDVYDPVTDTWSSAAPIPAPASTSGAARVGDSLYLVGGCLLDCVSTDVYRYDLANDTWTQVADYPEFSAWTACGGIDGTVYCAGGAAADGATRNAYSYDPGTDTWTPIADMPMDLWGGAHIAADGLLILAGGVTNGVTELTNEGLAYDPETDEWMSIPNTSVPAYRNGSSCGLYSVGGMVGHFEPSPLGSVLPGLNQCDGDAADVSWLGTDQSTVTIQPGDTVTLTVTLDASDPVLFAQPGEFSAQLLLNTHSPYSADPIDVRMTVTPPDTWGKITGTVIGTGCDGSSVGPLAGVTVQIDTTERSFTVFTDHNGHFSWWMDAGAPMTVIVAKDGWQPQFTAPSLEPMSTTTSDFTLRKAFCE